MILMLARLTLLIHTAYTELLLADCRDLAALMSHFSSAEYLISTAMRLQIFTIYSLANGAIYS